MNKLLVLLFALILSFAVFTPVAYADEEAAAEPVDAAETAEPVDAAEEAVEEAAEDEETHAVFSQDELKTIKETEESFEFQAEVSRLMDIIINSLYSNREIFIRELISNAADALDKIRYHSLTDSSALGDTTELKIEISYDKDAKTLTIRDTGCGMTKEELIKNLGVVAKSGTTEFVEAATQSQDSKNTLSLIGQFGVGFYSVYLVADRVTVVSQSYQGGPQHIWESAADRTFTVVEDPRGEESALGRGTAIILHLKEDAEEFLSESRLNDIVNRYSEFINFPIYQWTTRTENKEVPIEEEESATEGEEGEEDEDLEISEEEDDEEDDKPKTKTVSEEISEWKQVNDQKAIWTRSKDEITEEEYNSFFKALSALPDDPLSYIHFSAEGEISFRSILYIPKNAPQGLYDRYYEKSTALKLYVRRVLISDSFEDFLPRYLNFIHGVVDSDDLPLNVSRETLAQSRVLKAMGKKLTRKVLEMLRKLAAESEADEDEEEDDEDEEEEAEKSEEETEEVKEDKEVEDKYKTFWESFGKSIKLGLIDDRANKSKLTKLLRFRSSKSDGAWISLENYVDNMQDEQKYIYYITGQSDEQVSASPFMEQLRKRDLEVLYLTDPLDEYVTQSLTEFDGMQLMSITKEGLKFGDEDDDKEAKIAEMFKPLTDWMTELYGDQVETVRVSNRLNDSPCVLVTGQYGWSANMERIMGAQTMSSGKQNFMKSKKTMEINPRHPIIQELKNRQETSADDESTKDLAGLLFDAALVQSGFSVADATPFATRIHRVVALGLNVDPDAPLADEIELPEEEEEDEEVEDEDESEDLDDAEEAEAESEEAEHDEL